jgi:hypothetical protein
MSHAPPFTMQFGSSQQKPSMHLFVPHTASAMQGAPTGATGVQTPRATSQVLPVEQSVARVQRDKHAFDPQTYGLHETIALPRQFPLPSHDPFVVATPAVQLAADPQVEPIGTMH